MKGAAVIACIYFISLVFSETPEKVIYNGNQLWIVKYENKTARKFMETLQEQKLLTLWGLNSSTFDAMIHADSIDAVRAKLSEKHMEYMVVIEDVQKAIDESNPKPGVDAEGRRGYRLTWNYYHDLDDIYEYLHYLEKTFPKLCTVRTIGRSVEGRPIKLLRISNGKRTNRAIFLEGGIHAREWISPAAATFIIHRFVSNYEKESDSIRNIDWYVVPVLNPDGYEYSYRVDRLWRKNRARYQNCTGVDLNRNWGYDWDNKNGSSCNPCSNSFRGRRPFSEPETAAVANWFINNPQINWMGYIALHSYGQHIVFPWGKPNAVLEDHDELNRIGVEAANKIAAVDGESYDVGPVASTIYSTSGISMDWAKGTRGVKYTFTVELRDQGRYGFILPSKFIELASEEALIIVRTIADAAW